MECASKSTVVMYTWLQQVACIAINSHIAKCLLLAIHSTLTGHVSHNSRHPLFRVWREVKAVCNMSVVSKGQRPAFLRMVSPFIVLVYRCCIPVMSWSSLSVFVYEKRSSREERQNTLNLWFNKLFFFHPRYLSCTGIPTLHTHSKQET